MSLIFISNCRLDFWLQWLRFSLDVGCRRRRVMIDVCEVEIISSRRLSNTASAARAAHCQFNGRKTRPRGQQLDIFLHFLDWDLKWTQTFDFLLLNFCFYLSSICLVMNLIESTDSSTFSGSDKNMWANYPLKQYPRSILVPHKELGISLAK